MLPWKLGVGIELEGKGRGVELLKLITLCPRERPRPKHFLLPDWTIVNPSVSGASKGVEEGGGEETLNRVGLLR